MSRLVLTKTAELSALSPALVAELRQLVTALNAGIVGRSLTHNGAAGTIQLYNQSGTAYYLWVDATGTLRLHTAAPTEDGSTVSDTAGTIVGTQS